MLPLAMLRARWASFAGTFVALALGVALISATALVFDSARPRVPQRFAGAAVVVRGPQATQYQEEYPEYRPWPADAAAALVDRLAAIPGVATAVPDRTFYAQVVVDGRPVGDPDRLDPQGHGWSSAALAPYRLTAGRSPAVPGEVVLDAALGIAPGARVTVLTGAGPVEHTVTGTVDGPGVYLSDPAAGALAGGVQVIGLRLTEGADAEAVAAAARAAVEPGVRVLTGGARGELEPPLATQTRWIGGQVLTGMVALAAFAAVFVVASTATFSVVQRRRDLALLRAAGATPRQVRRMVLAETLGVGVLAGVLGAVLGAAAAPVLGGMLADAGLEPSGFTVRVSPGPLAASVVTGLVVALLGAVSAARRAARVRPLEALRESAAERRPMTPARWVFGLLFLVGGVAAAARGATAAADRMMNLAMLGAMALMVALALLAPVLLPPLIRVLAGPFARLRAAGGELVRESAVAAVRRTAATTAPVLLTVGFAALVTGAVATMSAAFATGEARQAGADLVVVPAGTPGLSDAAVRAAAIGRTASGLESTVLAGDAPLSALGVDQASLAYLAGRVEVRSGSLRRPGIAVTAWVAGNKGWRTGATLPLTFADGRTERLPLAAILSDDSAPADVVLSRDTVRAHDPSALTGRVYVTGATAADLDRALAGLGARTLSTAEYARVADAEEDRLVRLFVLALIGLACGYTGIAVANTQVMATADRRRDLALLRLGGATRRQVLVLVAGEAALVVALGTGLGLAVAATALLGVRAGLAEKVGTAVDLVLDWPAVTAVCAACVVLAVGAAVVPAALAVRGNPAVLAGGGE